MLRYTMLALVLYGAVRVQAQQATSDSAPLADPKAMLAAAAKQYDLGSADLKPWHLKASYRLYDLKGNPTQEGTWEYWWAAPKVHRSTWTREGADRTDWATADGKLYRKESGEPLKHFERTIDMSLISPLPAEALIDSGRMRLGLKTIPAGSGQITCVSTTLQWVVDGKPQAPSSGMPGYYCFDPPTMALRMISGNSVNTEFSRIVKFQGRYLARDMAVSIGKTKAFSVSVETIDVLGSAEAGVNPPADAQPVLNVVSEPNADSSGGSVTTGSLVKKTQPVYPMIAKASRVQGTVVLAAVIGKDGKIRDLEVLASPSDLLTKSARDSVQRWEYKPYLLNGAPVEVDTVVNVTYSLSY